MYLCHGWILPEHDLVLRVSMSAHYLIDILAPRQIADLASSVNAVQLMSVCGVPESNASVCGSTS